MIVAATAPRWPRNSGEPFEVALLALRAVLELILPSRLALGIEHRHRDAPISRTFFSAGCEALGFAAASAPITVRPSRSRA